MLLVQGRQLPVRESALSEFMVSEQAVWVPAGWSVEQTQLALDTLVAQPGQSGIYPHDRTLVAGFCALCQPAATVTD